MKALKVTYSRLISKGNYENAKIEIELEVEQGEKAAEVYEAVKNWVEKRNIMITEEEQQNEHIQRVTTRYCDKEITTAIIPEQAPEYHKALEEGDVLKAHLLHKPTWHKPYWMIESEMKFAQLEAEYKAELKRIEEMPTELLKAEMELRYGKPNASDLKPRMCRF